MTSKNASQRFILSGFTQQGGFRLFAFEEIAADHQRVRRTVRADLGLIHRYSILIQDLPLLCRDLLERCSDQNAAASLTFTEDDMRTHREVREAAQRDAAHKRKAPSPTVRNSSAWRTTAALTISTRT